MASRLTIAASTFLLMTGQMGADVFAADLDLKTFKWENRLVITFADSADETELYRQTRYRNSALVDWQERDLVLINIGPEGRVHLNGQIQTATNASLLRQRFQVPEGGFKAILVGKDGRVKDRASEAFSNEDLFRTIDAMPMRRSEIESGK